MVNDESGEATSIRGEPFTEDHRPAYKQEIVTRRGNLAGFDGTSATRSVSITHLTAQSRHSERWTQVAQAAAKSFAAILTTLKIGKQRTPT
jgi:hypothetical protein